MDYLFYGIDVSKATLDYAYLSAQNREVSQPAQTTNDVKGIKQLIKQITKQQKTHQVWVCFEHTGNYGLLLACLLQQAGITYSMVNPLEVLRSSGMTRGKSDPIDAQRLAKYAYTFREQLKPSVLPTNTLLKIKALLSVRDQYVRMRTQLINARKSLEVAHQVASMKQQLNYYAKDIQAYDKRIRQIEKDIDQLIQSDESLMRNFEKISQVIGIGPVTATALIVFTNNFQAFDNNRKFNCYSGLAPFEHSSGTSVNRRSRTSSYRNKMMKKLLFNAACSAILHDEQLKRYYRRKRAEGKPRLSVLNAVACKLVARVFAVVNREEPFVKLKM